MSATASETVELRVAGKTPTAELASAISHAIYDGKKVALRAVGAGAVNQAVKGLVVAQGYVSQRGLMLAFRPGFANITMDGEERTAIVFYVVTFDRYPGLMARTEDFASGFESVREPQFQSVQQQHARNFQATSVLDNIMPNQNGMGAQDFQRRLVGFQDSAVGRSSETYDRQLWLRHQEPSQRIKRLEGQQDG